MVGTASTNPLAADLGHVLEHTRELWEELRGQRLFITGGTGFFGCWLLESALWANAHLKLNLSITVLTRDEAGFKRKAPHLGGDTALTFHRGDVRTFEFPSGRFSHVIHAATASGSSLGVDDPLLMFDTIVSGTKRTLDFARRSQAKRFLLTSSGAVYGRQPTDVDAVPEDFRGGPDQLDPRSSYGEGKRCAEALCALYADRYGVEPVVARGFTFVGPYLPLDQHFAIGNFVRDAMAGGPIRVTGDGSPRRSYLYAADLAIWLWTVLLRGRPVRAYNVGSPVALSIAELAELVAHSVPAGAKVARMKQPAPGGSPERYVPSVDRARDELGLTVRISLEDAVRRTVAWHDHRKTPVAADK